MSEYIESMSSAEEKNNGQIFISNHLLNSEIAMIRKDFV